MAEIPENIPNQSESSQNWAKEIAAIADEASNSPDHQPIPDLFALFDSNITIETLPSTEEGERFSRTPWRGLVTEIHIEDEDADARSVMHLVAHQMQAQEHRSLRRHLPSLPEEGVPFSWHGEPFLAQIRWIKYPLFGGSLQKPMTAAHSDEAFSDLEVDVTLAQHLHPTPDTPPDNNAAMEALGYAISESLVNKLIKNQQPSGVDPHLSLAIQWGTAPGIYVESELSDLIGEGSTDIDHERFSQLLDEAPREIV